MIVYKIRHKPTGLFFRPAKDGPNVSTRGKLYEKRPTLKWLGGILHWPKGEKLTVPKYQCESRKVVLSEWEIVEYGGDPKKDEAAA